MVRDRGGQSFVGDLLMPKQMPAEMSAPDTNTNADDGARPLFSDGSNGGSPGKGRGDTQRSDGSFHHVQP